MRIPIAGLVVVLASLATASEAAATQSETSDWWSLDEVVAAVQQEPDIIIGVRDGPRCEMFGSITDVDVDAEGRIFVLDGMDHVVRVFDSTGECLFDVGRQGAGPGEFRMPEQIGVTRSGRLLVLDPGNTRIEEFDVSGDAPERIGSTRLDVRGISLCTMEDRRFLGMFRQERMVAELDESGSFLQRFGAYDDDAGSIQRLLASPERTLCHRQSRTVVVAGRHTPEVRRYDLSGEAISTGEVEEFRAAELVVRQGRVAGYGPGPEGIDYFARLVELEEPTVLLQTGVPNRSGLFRGVRSFAFDIDRATSEPVDIELPHVFLTRGPWLVAAHHDVVGRLGVWHRQNSAN